MKFTIYSTTTCPYCKMLKDYLTKKGISFEEKLVDQSDEDREEMSKLSDGFLGVPFSVLTREDGSMEKIVGFDMGKLNKMLGFDGKE